MKKSYLRFKTLLLIVSLLLCASSIQSVAFARRSFVHDPHAATVPIQYDDPYTDFRNARYSNAGLLSESDEIKLGTQLHREVTKKFNLTNIGLDRVERIGQDGAKARL